MNFYNVNFEPSVRTERLYRVRVGDYRIIYKVDTEAEQITVHYIRHRREVYRAL